MTERDWEEARQRVMAEGRERVGALPDDDVLLAYSRGELPPEETERIRELLVYYPDVSRALASPFPDEAELSAAEMKAGWEAIAKRTGAKRLADAAEPPRVRWRSLALAASLLVVLASGVLLLRTEDAPVPTRLVPRETRGPGNLEPVLLTEGKGDALLILVVAPDNVARTAALIDGTTGERIRTFDDVRCEEETCTVRVPGRLIEQNRTYRLELYGIDGGREERLHTYLFRRR